MRNCVRKLGTTRRDEKFTRRKEREAIRGETVTYRGESVIFLRSPYIERITPLRSTVISQRRFYLRRPVTDEEPGSARRPSPIKTLPLSIVLLICISLCSLHAAIVWNDRDPPFVTTCWVVFQRYLAQEFLRLISSNGKFK